MNSFDKYAAYYDLLYTEKDYDGEAIYVDKLLRRFGLTDGGTLLEIGCGTGKHASYFVENCLKYIGIDQSASMIAESRVLLSNKVTLHVADARDFCFKDRFDAIYSLFHVVSYLATDSDLDNCFKAISDHLRPDGVFLFDCWHGPAVEIDPPTVRYKTMNGNGCEVHRVAIPSFVDDRIHIDFKVWIHKENELDGSRFDESHILRPYSVRKLQDHLAKVDLEIVHSEEWMSAQPLSEHTWYATHVVKKK